MNARRALETTLVVLAIIFAGSLLLGQALGQPVLLGYVETGSMEPTLSPGDGFIAIPTEIAGPIEEGDVVTFEAQELHGGDLTTHRVVGETSRGFITKGDANAVTDQDSVEPPVKRGQIVAVALQVGGEVVSMPQLGTVTGASSTAITKGQEAIAKSTGIRDFRGPEGLAYILFTLGVLGYAASTLFAANRPSVRSRASGRRAGILDTRVVIVALAALLVAVLTLSMVIPAGVQHFDIVSSETDEEGAGIIPVGGTESFTYRVPSNGLFPTVVYLAPHTEGVDVTPRRMVVDSNGNVNATVTLTAPPQTGYYERAIIEDRYLAIIPASTIHGLYQIHPWLPIVVIDAVVALGFFVVAVVLVGWGRIRIDSGRSSGLRQRLERRFR